jgi:hypothetical protein
MLLRNGKIIGKDITISCVEKLPYEILSIISDYHHCKVCFRNKNKHCYNCNECNINELHMTCDKCKICYAKYKTRIFNNMQYYHTLNMHIHCKNCDTVKEKDYYFCSKCKQVSE